MSNTRKIITRSLAALALALLVAGSCAAQDSDTFKKLQAVDFTKQKVARDDLKDVELYELSLLRGVVFGRHGRVFKERDIQAYLKDQPWYKPDPNFKNESLNERERTNLDLIRELEAEKHDQIEPGDLRWWQAKAMTEESNGQPVSFGVLMNTAWRPWASFLYCNGAKAVNTNEQGDATS